MKYNLVRLCFSNGNFQGTQQENTEKTTTKKVFLLMNLVEKKRKQITQQDRERGKS